MSALIYRIAAVLLTVAQADHELDTEIISEPLPDPFTSGLSITQDDFSYHCLGNCNSNLPDTQPSPAVILIGGDSGLNVDAAFESLIGFSDGGNVLILNAQPDTNTDAYDYKAHIHALGGSNSVSSLTIHSAQGCSAEFVLDKINAADALVVTGDAAAEISDSLLEHEALYEAIQRAVQQRGVPIAGTSHGASLLSAFVDLDDDEDNSETALIEPHFSAHDDADCRRMLALMAQTDDATRGIGLTDDAALVIDVESKVGTVYANDDDAVYILISDSADDGEAAAGSTVSVQKLVADDRYDFNAWRGGREELGYTLSAADGYGELMGMHRSVGGGGEHGSRRARVHRLVVLTMWGCCVVIVAASGLFFREQLLARKLRESECVDVWREYEV